jgi:hypothetical protein
MKIQYAATLLLLIATPALADATKTVGSIKFSCVLTGSGDSGFDIITENSSKDSRTCTSSCKLTKKDGKTQEWKYSSRTVRTGKSWFGGEASVSGSPLSKPDLTSASCS